MTSNSYSSAESNKRVGIDRDEEERINILRVTLAELTSGKTTGRVYESASVGSVFFLANRSNVRNRVMHELSELRQK
jgi:hypothetical protein